jgi:hypothetical protein
VLDRGMLSGFDMQRIRTRSATSGDSHSTMTVKDVNNQLKYSQISITYALEEDSWGILFFFFFFFFFFNIM